MHAADCSSITPLPAPTPPQPPKASGIGRYIKKKKLDPLETYVPLVLEAQEQLLRLKGTVGAFSASLTANQAKLQTPCCDPNAHTPPTEAPTTPMTRPPPRPAPTQPAQSTTRPARAGRCAAAPLPRCATTCAPSASMPPPPPPTPRSSSTTSSVSSRGSTCCCTARWRTGASPTGRWLRGSCGRRPRRWRRCWPPSLRMWWSGRGACWTRSTGCQAAAAAAAAVRRRLQRLRGREQRAWSSHRQTLSCWTSCWPFGSKLAVLAVLVLYWCNYTPDWRQPISQGCVLGKSKRKQILQKKRVNKLNCKIAPPFRREKDRHVHAGPWLNAASLMLVQMDTDCSALTCAKRREHTNGKAQGTRARVAQRAFGCFVFGRTERCTRCTPERGRERERESTVPKQTFVSPVPSVCNGQTLNCVEQSYTEGGLYAPRAAGVLGWVALLSLTQKRAAWGGLKWRRAQSTWVCKVNVVVNVMVRMCQEGVGVG